MGAIIDALGINFWTVFWQAINVLIILAGLYFIFWKLLIKTLIERQEKIEGNIKEAALAREKAEEVLASYEEKIDQAHQETRAILEKATRLGEETRQEIINQAKQEAARILEQARLDIEREKRAAVASLRSQAADLILTATSRVLARTLTPVDQEELVRAALTEVERIQ
ncbi:MAG: F0F1 ATP synthase subunit B [Firmicutes bacterium]|nr:F0F1 ATP synthase subunit B [Bacillota bacterium]